MNAAVFGWIQFFSVDSSWTWRNTWTPVYKLDRIAMASKYLLWSKITIQLQLIPTPQMNKIKFWTKPIILYQKFSQTHITFTIKFTNEVLIPYLYSWYLSKSFQSPWLLLATRRNEIKEKRKAIPLNPKDPLFTKSSLLHCDSILVAPPPLPGSTLGGADGSTGTDWTSIFVSEPLETAIFEWMYVTLLEFRYNELKGMNFKIEKKDGMLNSQYKEQGFRYIIITITMNWKNELQDREERNLLYSKDDKWGTQS